MTSLRYYHWSKNKALWYHNWHRKRIQMKLINSNAHSNHCHTVIISSQQLRKLRWRCCDVTETSSAKVATAISLSYLSFSWTTISLAHAAFTSSRLASTSERLLSLLFELLSGMLLSLSVSSSRLVWTIFSVSHALEALPLRNQLSSCLFILRLRLKQNVFIQ